MRLNLFILLIFILSCNTKQTDSESKNNSVDTIGVGKSLYIDSTVACTEIIETFVDSLNIGEKGKCKVDLIKHRVYDDNYIVVKFYIMGRNTIKDPEKWMVTNNYSYESNALMGFEPNLSDYNNDNFKDITFVSGSAARGANEVRRLFIYDDQKKELISIVNSQDYPNMLYNKKLDCIDAFLVHGGSSTIFARLKGDSLKEFASIHNDSQRTIYIIDENGNEKLLRKDKISNEDIYVRYINFNPPQPYGE